MFTGIVTGVGTVRDLTPIGAGADLRLVIAAPWPDTHAIPVGASIACAGCCLTAIDLGPDWFAVTASAETLSKTTLGGWQPGTRLNLERPLRVGDELGGHIVSGHVDGVGEVVSVTPEHGSSRWQFLVPEKLARFIAPKGSVAIDGVSPEPRKLGVPQAGGVKLSSRSIKVQFCAAGLCAPLNLLQG